MRSASRGLAYAGFLYPAVTVDYIRRRSQEVCSLDVDERAVQLGSEWAQVLRQHKCPSGSLDLRNDVGKDNENASLVI